MRASRARSHRSSSSASIHEESIHIMFEESSVSVNTSRVYAYQFLLLKAIVMMATGSSCLCCRVQARATAATQQQNSELSQQVNELHDQLQAERANTQERINLERVEREQLQERCQRRGLTKKIVVQTCKILFFRYLVLIRLQVQG
ncbi:uncharacterized protein [Triticum aestivum]|uniref:uncharacterized protein isoform X2 n=1 Tax=Triticum aestivum TaxID=4565 RepID=UPI001D03088A|nr:uncharacterized protein LOC123051311 isoform X2 [Triticum aestivum]